jgi:hypothetical protein
MAICGFGLPARCCQPAVAGHIIYADLWGELSTHLAPQALFTQSSPVQEPLLQAFPFPSTLGEVTLHLLWQACVFIYSSRGKWVFHPLLWSFPPSATLRSFPLLVAGRDLCSHPLWPGLACLFTVLGGIPLPPSSVLSAPHPLCYLCLLFLLLITLSPFSLGGGWSVQGAMLIWPRVVCGSTVYRLAHLVCFFPRRVGVGIWRPGGPPGFSV